MRGSADQLGGVVVASRGIQRLAQRNANQGPQLAATASNGGLLAIVSRPVRAFAEMSPT
jgi:hypothetical protein